MKKGDFHGTFARTIINSNS